MTSKSAHWQAAFRCRMREAGLKSVTIWMSKEGADRLARYPEKERGEVITRALVLLESQGEFRGDDAILTGESTDKSTGEVVVALSETPLPPVALSTATLTDTTPPEHPAKLGTSPSRVSGSDKLPPERVAALRCRAKTCGLSWGEIAQRFNAEGIPSPSGGQWHGATVAKLVRGE